MEDVVFCQLQWQWLRLLTPESKANPCTSQQTSRIASMTVGAWARAQEGTLLLLSYKVVMLYIWELVTNISTNTVTAVKAMHLKDIIHLAHMFHLMVKYDLELRCIVKATWDSSPFRYSPCSRSSDVLPATSG